MNDEDEEKRLLSLMVPRRHEAFWLAQKRRILARVKPRRSRAWLLLPAAVTAGVLLLLSRPPVQPPPAEPPVSTAFLEQLDLLDDMDVLEAVPEEKL